MPQYVVKQVADIYTKEYRNKDLIFTERNESTLEVYDNNASTHDVTAEVDNKYNHYKSNEKSYEDGSNNEEDGATYEDGTRYPATPTTKNNPENF